MRSVPNLRWWIAGLLAAATALNYLDRQSLPVVITEVQKSIPVSDQQYSQMQFFFLLAYGVMYAAGGRIIDFLGTRAGYAVMIVWWSCANILQGTVHTVTGLSTARFLLGLGEGGGFPGSAKAVSEWFPARERAFAFGLFNTGSSVGAVIAPPLIALIVAKSDWRWVFYLTGSLGIIWAALWLLLYAPPAKHKLVTAAELRYVLAGTNEQVETRRVSWRRILSDRQVWTLMGAKFLSDSAWFFFIFWLPKYLGDVRHLDIRQIGYYAWVPYALAGVGSFAGGLISSSLLRRGVSIISARKIALTIGAACMPASLLIATSPLTLALVFFSLAMFGHQFWSTILQTLAADMFPSFAVGTVAGVMGAAGSFGAMLFNLLVGAMLTSFHSYAPVFLISGVLHPLALGLILIGVRRTQPVSEYRAI